MEDNVRELKRLWRGEGSVEDVFKGVTKMLFTTLIILLVFFIYAGSGFKFYSAFQEHNPYAMAFWGLILLLLFRK
jgi:hypothetical protein